MCPCPLLIYEKLRVSERFYSRENQTPVAEVLPVYQKQGVILSHVNLRIFLCKVVVAIAFGQTKMDAKFENAPQMTSDPHLCFVTMAAILVTSVVNIPGPNKIATIHCYQDEGDTICGQFYFYVEQIGRKSKTRGLEKGVAPPAFTHGNFCNTDHP